MYHFFAMAFIGAFAGLVAPMHYPFWARFCIAISLVVGMTLFKIGVES